MANSYTCSCCKKDGTRCNCYRAGSKCVACRQRVEMTRPYQPSQEEQLRKEQLYLRSEWRKYGVDYKIQTPPTSLHKNCPHPF